MFKGAGFWSGMRGVALAVVIAAIGGASAAGGAEQGEAVGGATGASSRAAPELSVSTPMLRSMALWMGPGWSFLDRVPDVRLKLDTGGGLPGSAAEMERRVKGMEVRLPMRGTWVGMENVADEGPPRATLSIQRGF